jgi:hypothetical protein
VGISFDEDLKDIKELGEEFFSLACINKDAVILWVIVEICMSTEDVGHLAPENNRFITDFQSLIRRYLENIFRSICSPLST